MTVTVTRSGGRRIEFYVQQKLSGGPVTEITLAPVKFDHVLRWNNGEITSALALLAELTAMDESAIRQLTFPDAERVLAEFMHHVPEQIREDINSGRRPVGARVTDPQPVAPGEFDDVSEFDARSPPGGSVDGGGGEAPASSSPFPPDSPHQAALDMADHPDEDAGFELDR